MIKYEVKSKRETAIEMGSTKLCLKIMLVTQRDFEA